MRILRDGVMTSWKSAVAVAACLALAPVAQAQVACADIDLTVNAALEDFEPILGEELDDFNYATSFEMPGASACTIAVEWDALYQCLWVYGSEAEARATYNALTGVAASCLSDWKPEGVLEDLPLPETAVAHMVRSGAGDYLDMEVLIHLNRFEEQSDVTWEIWYEVIYYLL
jgi:hypothetical protein